MNKILKFLYILQVADNRNVKPKLGRGFFTAYRINPYNPLSYIFIALASVAALLMFGIVGMWREMDFRNPFKWN